MWKVLNWSSDLSYIYSGNDPGKPCVFPFIWKDEIYDTCTDFGRSFSSDKVKLFSLPYQTLSFLITYRISAPLRLMMKEKSNILMINTVTVVLAVLQKMMMSGWLMIPWQWPITMMLLMMIQTVSSIRTSLTLSLLPPTVHSLRNGLVWWEFIQRQIRPTWADLFGGVFWVHISFTTLVTNNYDINNIIQNIRNIITVESWWSPSE